MTFRGTGSYWAQAFKDIQRNIVINSAIVKTVSNLGDDVSKIVYDEAYNIMQESKENYVPVLTGRLRSSGRVGIPQYGKGAEIFVDLSYNTPYAWFVHQYHRTKGHYLKIPFEDSAMYSDILENRIADKILKSLGF